MLQVKDLQRNLDRIDGKGYKSYKDIQGDYDLGSFVLHIDNVQSDPFAPPSRMRITVGQDKAGIPEDLYSNSIRRVALEDYLTRLFSQAVSSGPSKVKGTGKSGLIGIDCGGQEILPRSSMCVDNNSVQARFNVGLPARGRTVMGRQAAYIFFQELPSIVDKALIYKNIDQAEIRKHVNMCEDQEELRRGLKEKGLVAFVADGSVLPRQSGVSDRPLRDEKVVAFSSPDSLKVSFDLPHSGSVKGMGIPQGVTLIVGGGYHGKSTLLKALERGVYNHIPSDGRHLVVTREDAVKIRAEDGRSVSGVNIQPFISALPFGQDTRFFSSDNASGSTSQASNIVEALEAGSKLLLLDEDTSATNFMIRDGRMQQLVLKQQEPITPFIDRVQEMYSNLGVSTILVLGGSGDYFDVSDKVIMLKEYEAYEVTEEARKVASIYKNLRQAEGKEPLSSIGARTPLQESFRLGSRDKIKSQGRQLIAYGREKVNLAFVEQLVDASQTKAIAEIFRLLGQRYANGQASLAKIIDEILAEVNQKGLDILSPFQGKHPGDLALPRKQEIFAAINRYRRLKVK